MLCITEGTHSHRTKKLLKADINNLNFLLLIATLFCVIEARIFSCGFLFMFFCFSFCSGLCKTNNQQSTKGKAQSKWKSKKKGIDKIKYM